MNYRFLLLLSLSLLVFFSSCDDDDTSYILQDISAPSNIQVNVELAQDDSGELCLTPTAVGASTFEVFYGDEANETPTTVSPGERVCNIYGEGTFDVRVVAIGSTNLTSEWNQNLTISFTPPSDLNVDIAVSGTDPNTITVTPSAANATLFDIYFGDVMNEEPTTIMNGESAMHTYTATGFYDVRVVAKGAGAATIETTQTVEIREPVSFTAEDIQGTWRLANESGALGVGPAPGDISWFAIDDQGVIDRACYFDDIYVFGSDGSFSNELGAETWIEGWQNGTGDACGTPIAPHDGSVAATYSVDGENATLTVSGMGAYIGLPKAVNEGELPNVALPASITYNVTLNETKDSMNVIVEAGAGVFWQYRLARFEVPPSVEGTWVLASEAGSLGVGPAPGDISWFSIDDQGVIERACYFDDQYRFNADGSFENILGADTWLEGWQTGETDACGAAIAPHDGSMNATYTFDAETGVLTVEGTGAYIGLPKAVNAGELPNVELPSSITYNVTLENSNTTMNIVVEAGSGVFWQYKLIKV